MLETSRSCRRTVSIVLLIAGLALAAGCSGDGTEVGGSDAVVEDPSGYRYRCEVSFRIDGPVSTYEEVAVSANFASSLGTFLVDSKGARCVGTLAEPAAGEQEGQNNNPAEPEAQRRDFFVTLDDVEGLALPADIATCVFLAVDEPAVEDFALDTGVWQPTGSTATPSYFNRPKASAVVECTEFQAPDTTTSTTLDECSAVECASGEECRAGACAALKTGRVEIYLDSAARLVGSVQVQIDYGDSGARFTHETGRRACQPNDEATGWLYAECDFRQPNDAACAVVPGFHSGELGLGIATLQSIEAPKLLASCDVAAEDLDKAVSAMRIELIEVAASDDLQPIDGKVSIRLARD